MNTDDTFMHQIKSLRAEKAPDALYQRIMTVVPNLPQQHVEAPRSRLERFFAEWSYGLKLKFASLVLLGILGFCVGHLNGLSAHQDRFFTDIVTGDIGWED